MTISPIYRGRPAGRALSEAERRSYDILEALGIEFFRVEHDEAPSISALETVEQALGCRICKNLFLTNRQQTDFYLLLMPGNKPFKTKYLSAQLGCSRLSFASGAQLLEMLDVSPGSASLLALAADRENRVRLVIDQELENDEYFACHPCKNTATLKMRLCDVQKTLIPSLGHKPVFVTLPWESGETL